jgi:hypothetical protein
MDSVGRLLLRFILVPFGYAVAVLAGTMVILAHAWNLGQAVTAHADAQAVATFGFLFAAPVLLVLLLSVMWLPASVGILLSEVFAIRSWAFHVGNGAAAAWLGWGLFGFIDDSRIPLNHPLAVIAAGIAGGFAYWAIAGLSAGFWKPVFRGQEARAVPPSTASSPRQIR